MKKFKAWIQRDKLGIVRGGVALGALIVVCALAFLYVLAGFERAAEQERACAAVQRVAGQFEQMLEDAFSQIDAGASLINSGVAEDMILETLTTDGSFADAAVVRDGQLRRADGSVEPATGAIASSYYSGGASPARVIPQKDGSIQLRINLTAGGELAGWLDPQNVDDVLSGAYAADYGYAVYNSSTGAYLLNHTPFEQRGYYDAMLELGEHDSVVSLMNASSGQARIEGAGEVYYVVQRPSGIYPWNIALIIPETLVDGGPTEGLAATLLVVVSAILLTGILGAHSFLALRRQRAADAHSAQMKRLGVHMLGVAASEARATLFVHRRGSDEPQPCFDGLGLLDAPGERMRKASMSELVDACKLDEEDEERLHERMRELGPGQSADLIIQSGALGKEEHALRFALSAPASDADSVCICIQDCTLEILSMDQAEAERGYRAAMEPRSASIWEINISRNRWRAVYAKSAGELRALGVRKNCWRDYSADLGGVLREYVHPADYTGSFEKMSIASITALYRSGHAQFVQDYRVRAGDGDGYVWHRMTVHTALAPETGDIMAHVYVFNVDAEKNAELERMERSRILNQSLTAMGGIYYGLYYVDLEHDLCYTAKSHGGELVSELCAPYKASIEGYIADSVHPEDQAALRELLDAYQLRRNMKEGSHFRRRIYRRRRGEGYERSFIIVQPARYENGTIREIVIALSSVERYGGVE